MAVCEPHTCAAHKNAFSLKRLLVPVAAPHAAMRAAVAPFTVLHHDAQRCSASLQTGVAKQPDADVSTSSICLGLIVFCSFWHSPRNGTSFSTADSPDRSRLGTFPMPEPGLTLVYGRLICNSERRNAVRTLLSRRRTAWPRRPGQAHTVEGESVTFLFPQHTQDTRESTRKTAKPQPAPPYARVSNTKPACPCT